MNEAKTIEIERKKYRTENKTSLAFGVILSLLGIFFVFIAFATIKQEEADDKLYQNIKVEFADNAMADTGVYSGVYEINKNKIDNFHVRYYEKHFSNNADRKMLAFCEEGQYWALIEAIKEDPCDDEYIVRSSGVIGSTYAIEKSQNTLWTAKNKIPLDFVVISNFDSTQCGGIISTGDDKQYDEECTDVDICDRIEVKLEATKVEVATGTKGSFILRMLADDDEPGKTVLAYGRPIFVEEENSIGNSTHAHSILVLYTGRRWISTSTEYIKPLKNNASNIQDYFNSGFHVSDLDREAISSMTEATPPTLTRSTPSELRWYGVEYLNLGYTDDIIPAVNIETRIYNASVCANCNNETNKCKNGRFCASDGVCNCDFDTRGALCQYPFTSKECILDELLYHNLSLSFDTSNYQGKVLFKLENDVKFDVEFSCEYESWLQRYVSMMFLFGAGEGSSITQGLHECEFKGIICENNSEITEIKLLPSGAMTKEGYIPTEIFKLTNLESFQLNLKATLPSEVGLVTNLEWLDLGYFDGPMPSEVGLLTKLTILDLWYSKLTGSIPSEIGLLKNLEKFDSDRNSFESNVPSEIGQLTKLTKLYLSENKLTGRIPSELGLMTELTLLNLDINNFTGQIPSELGLLTNLSKLNIENNYFTGPIPNELLQLVNETDAELVFTNFNQTVANNSD